MFRRAVIILLFIVIVSGCKEKKNSDIPANSINPEIITNPTTASSEKQGDNLPVFEFERIVHNFGTITAGEKISFAFRFKNAGNGNLLIRAAQGSCGCTVPEFPKEPIKPGGSGVINVTFDSSGREGHQEKSVSIISNTIPNTFMLTITGEVIGDPQSDESE